jgi:hypothetical protein
MNEYIIASWDWRYWDGKGWADVRPMALVFSGQGARRQARKETKRLNKLGQQCHVENAVDPLTALLKRVSAGDDGRAVAWAKAFLESGDRGEGVWFIRLKRTLPHGGP